MNCVILNKEAPNLDAVEGSATKGAECGQRSSEPLVDGFTNRLSHGHSSQLKDWHVDNRLSQVGNDYPFNIVLNMLLTSRMTRIQMQFLLLGYQILILSQ